LKPSRQKESDRVQDIRLPLIRPGQSVGLLGGSFDPPHEGHAHITREALKRFGLDRVWWLISPGNPLKARGPAPIERRLCAARAIMDHPRVAITDFEAQIGSRYTAETLKALRAARPGVRFVWLMGADNLGQFHLWQDWQDIIENVPVGVLARPGTRTSARGAKAARVYRAARLPARRSQELADCEAPAWCFINVPMNAQSSTRLRHRGTWPSSPEGA